jgi:hypothetical protein
MELSKMSWELFFPCHSRLGVIDSEYRLPMFWDDQNIIVE